MKPLSLHPHEVRQCLRTGSVLVVRVVKPQPKKERGAFGIPTGEFDWAWYLSPGCVIISCNPNGPDGYADKHSPFVVGERLWCRERFLPVRQCGDRCSVADATYACFRDGAQIHKAADGQRYFPWDLPKEPSWAATDRFKPANQMPQWASRLTVTPTSVEVKRVQDVTEEEAMAAGFSGAYCPAYVVGGEIIDPDGVLPSDEFKDAWQTLNPKHPWEQSPWCWMARVEVVK